MSVNGIARIAYIGAPLDIHARAHAHIVIVCIYKDIRGTTACNV